jgi:hypothetical protein
MIARLPASSRASKSVATPDTAAVRIDVIAEAFIMARSSPVSALKSSTPPWWASLPLAGFPGMTQIAFNPKAA